MTRSVRVSRSAVPTVCLSLPAEIVENEKQVIVARKRQTFGFDV